MTEKTYLEKVVEETLRPVVGALRLLHQEIAETMQIPDSPWKILNKPYDQLTEQEIMALFDIYHTEGETEPCPMCNWVARTELMKSRQDKKEGI
jgi:hypothetical protein